MPKTKEKPVNAKATDDGLEILPGPRRHNPYWTPPVIEPEPPKALEPVGCPYPEGTEAAYHWTIWSAVVAGVEEGRYLKQVFDGLVAAHMAQPKPDPVEPAKDPRERAQLLLTVLDRYDRQYGATLQRLTTWADAFHTAARAVSGMTYNINVRGAIADATRALSHPRSKLQALPEARTVDLADPDDLERAARELRDIQATVRACEDTPRAFISALKGLSDVLQRMELEVKKSEREGAISNYSVWRTRPPDWTVTVAFNQAPVVKAPTRDPWGPMY